MAGWDDFPTVSQGADPWAAFPKAERPTGEKVARLVGQGAQNFNDTIASAAGYPVDLVASGLKLSVPSRRQSQSPHWRLGEHQERVSITWRRSPASSASRPPDAPVRFDPENRSARRSRPASVTAAGALASTLLPAGVLAKAAPAGGLRNGWRRRSPRSP
jgi:hypothetical protein